MEPLLVNVTTTPAVHGRNALNVSTEHIAYCASSIA